MLGASRLFIYIQIVTVLMGGLWRFLHEHLVACLCARHITFDETYYTR
jgi:hypothetical protein